jgi:hypothetical protein
MDWILALYIIIVILILLIIHRLKQLSDAEKQKLHRERRTENLQMERNPQYRPLRQRQQRQRQQDRNAEMDNLNQAEAKLYQDIENLINREMQTEYKRTQRQEAKELEEKNVADMIRTLAMPLFDIYMGYDGDDAIALRADDLAYHLNTFDIHMDFPTYHSSRSLDERRFAASRQETKIDQMNVFTGLSQIHTSDKQNVHDSDVNKDLLESYNTILDDYKKLSENGFMWHFETNDDITSAIMKAGKKNAYNVVEKMSENLYISGLRDHEGNILLNVWNRSLHPENKEHKDDIQNAIIEQLDECYENGNIVCSSGRVGRVMSALTTLDFNPNVGKIMNKEAYRNEAFSEANRIMNDKISEYKNSNNDEKRLYADSFVDPSIETDSVSDNIKAEFKNDVLAKIDNYVEKNKQHIGHLKDEIIAGLVF